MPPNHSEDKNASPDLSKLLASIKEWKEVIGLVATVVAVLLSRFQLSGNLEQIVTYALSALIVGLGVLIIFKYKKRRTLAEETRRRREILEAERGTKPDTAFRHLDAYGETDTLPGADRRLEAARLVANLCDPNFTFGIVCGESGCGKTSMLRSAVLSNLKEVGKSKGFAVEYIQNPRDFSLKSGEEVARPLDRLNKELSSLKKRIRESRKHKDGSSDKTHQPLILIIDQFEEFFIEYLEAEQRGEIGKLLKEFITAKPRISVLCAIRKDYLADMHDFKDHLDDPIPVNNLFKLNNFTLTQAVNVIEECARRDSVQLDEEFAETLAADLAHGGLVRPPELQIVCSALLGNLTLDEYRLSGGATRILANHVEKVITVCRDTNFARRLLRAFCDFPANAKAKPQSIKTLHETLGNPPGLSDDQTQDLIAATLRQFKRARLIISEKREEEEELKHALVHDYLVNAVATATSDASTRGEEANQMLDYYRAQYVKDHKQRIPLGRLRFIYKHADRNKLSDPTTKRLFKTSLTTSALSLSGLTVLVLSIAFILAATITSRQQWSPKLIGKLGGDLTVHESIRIRVLPPGKELFATGFYGYQKGAGVWDLRTMRNVLIHKGEISTYWRQGFFAGDSGSQNVMFVNVFDKKEYRTPLKNQFSSINNSHRILGLSDSGKTLAYVDFLSEEPYLFTTYSIVEEKVKYSIKGCQETNRFERVVSNDGRYIIVGCEEGIDTFTPTLFDLQLQKVRPLLKATRLLTGVAVGTGGYSYDEKSQSIVTYESSEGVIKFAVWGMTGDTAITSITSDFDSLGFSVGQFSANGNYYYGRSGAEFYIYKIPTLERVEFVPENAREVIDYWIGDESKWVVWRNESSMSIWDMKNEPKVVKGLAYPATDYEGETHLFLNREGTQGILWRRKDNRLQLWNLDESKSIDLPVTERILLAQFTIDAQAVAVTVEDGTTIIYGINDGEEIAVLPNVGGREKSIYYLPECQAFNVWLDDGRLMQFQSGRQFFGGWWFWPDMRGWRFWSDTECPRVN